MIDNVLPGQDECMAQRLVIDEYGAMVECCLGGVGDMRNLEKKLMHLNFVHHASSLDSPGTEPEVPHKSLYLTICTFSWSQ